MTANQVVTYLILWGAIGACLFSAFVGIVFRSGAVYSARKADGTLKEKIPASGFLVMIGFVAASLVYFVAGNYLGLAQNQISIGLTALFALNYGLYLVLFAFDTLIIDGVVLAVWRPRFLRLSPELGRESMQTHIRKSLLVGIGLGLPFAALATTISYCWFMK